MKKIISILIIFIITIYSCKKKEIENWYISDCVKSYIAFKPGTYWIYEDDSTHLIDSISVNYLYNEFKDHYNQNNELDAHEQRINCNLSINGTPNNAYYFSAGYKVEFGYHLYGWIAGVYCDKNIYVIDSAQTIVNFATMSINNLMYSDVTELILNNYGHNFSFTRVDLFLVHNVGLIKWKINFRDGSTQQRSLVRYHIEI